MTYAAYTGHETLTFPDYLDLATGKTLTAAPGRSYDVSPASGRLVPDVPAGWFAVLDGQERSEDEAPGEAAEPETVAEPDENPGAEHDDGEPEGPQQF